MCNRIAVLRPELRLSRAALAEAVNVTPQASGTLEPGNHYPSLGLAPRICEVPGLPVATLPEQRRRLLGDGATRQDYRSARPRRR